MEGMALEQPESRPMSPVRHPAAVQFTIEGDLRYLSNHDELRMLTRALVRARWPIAYSQGFNPKPRVRLPLPRSVGTASLCELGLVSLESESSAESLAINLQAAMPQNCRLLGVIAPAPPDTPHPRRARYLVDLSAPESATAQDRIADVLARESIRVQRVAGPDRPAREVEIRRFIEAIEMDAGRLRLAMLFEEQRTARCGEVLTALGLPGETMQHRIVLEQIDWDLEYAGWTHPPATH